MYENLFWLLMCVACLLLGMIASPFSLYYLLKKDEKQRWARVRELTKRLDEQRPEYNPKHPVGKNPFLK